MEPKNSQEPIPVTSPSTDALLEHHLVNADKNAKTTHALLENHLEKGATDSASTQAILENQLEIQGRIADELKQSNAKPQIGEITGEASVIIKAAKGDKGDQGIKGDKGDTGPAGPQGPKGADSTVPGPQGPMGPLGPAGPTGKPGPSGKDGLDGKDGRDGVDGKDGKPGKDGSPDTPEELLSKLKSLPKENKLSYDDLKDTPRFPRLAGTGFLREISDVNTTGLAHGQVLVWNANTSHWEPGSASGATPKRFRLSPLLNGSTKVFAIPANTAIVSINSSSVPFIFDDGDYTGSGTTTLTFGSGIDAPSMLASGQTVIVIYY